MNETETVIRNFMRNLSTRLRNENRLSDILYSLMNSSKVFLELFYHYIFPNLPLPDKIYREYISYNKITHERPRADFVFKTNSGINSLLEVKLWDRNYHDLQYKNAFPDYHRSIISIADYDNIDKGCYENLVKFDDLFNFIEMKLEDMYFSIHKVMISELVIHYKRLTGGKLINEIIENESYHIKISNKKWFTYLKNIKLTDKHLLNKRDLFLIFNTMNLNDIKKTIAKFYYEPYRSFPYVRSKIAEVLFNNYKSLDELLNSLTDYGLRLKVNLKVFNYFEPDYWKENTINKVDDHPVIVDGYLL